MDLAELDTRLAGLQTKLGDDFTFVLWYGKRHPDIGPEIAVMVRGVLSGESEDRSVSMTRYGYRFGALVPDVVDELDRLRLEEFSQ